MKNFNPINFLKNLTSHPGIYQIVGKENKTLYVGKAKNLKKRISSYFQKSNLTPKTRALINQIHNIKITITETEKEALILENNLIKNLQPRYNILLRDDKTYPYIFISKDTFPRIGLHRGIKKDLGRYFGPYPDTKAVRKTLKLLQEIFPIRQCTNSFYYNRSRPCLEYQIKHCTAPCVGLINKENYHQYTQYVAMFLSGESKQVIDELIIQMEKSSQSLAFEQAADYRNKITHLRQIHAHSYSHSEDIRDADILGAVIKAGIACIEVSCIRGGHHLGNKTFLPKFQGNITPQELISAFIPQYYLNREPPSLIILSHQPDNLKLLIEVLSQHARRNIQLLKATRNPKSQWVKMVLINAEIKLDQHLTKKTIIIKRFKNLQQLLQLNTLPRRLECFDISHNQGEATIASCAVFTAEGPCNTDYRRFNIEGITPRDDYAALHQALTRHYQRLIKNKEKFPDLLIIDGGKGQLSQAIATLEEIGITQIPILGIAKGDNRKAGEEMLFLKGHKTPIIRASDSPALHLLQHIRDEAHRFAITGHSQRSVKKRTTSLLERIIGLGPKRRQQLLTQLGGLQEISKARIEDLTQIKGINKKLAQRIYDYFHRK
ncbi:excinuclease ABC subunit C [Candidatus Nitrosoglobus terrae]|uniref:UvrABC system protein C n=1 Tax=Candidatus Nitrosoglobus terrae TaxID=1630141 RepID=A0A1Q2SMT6_9GAMM|nr:excinuclease ABC subunit UvrC [Candidatus Nitrosoglobus terrae]BAW80432.1 excinuclease ABC subunit C [Candidatus Nitrosoglobus terrae]